MSPRCFWVPTDDPLYTTYHDTEWGRPVADDTRLFEKICLEGFQAGLSWRTILAKRDNFRAAFRGFDPRVVADFGDRDVARLLLDAGIVRHEPSRSSRSGARSGPTYGSSNPTRRPARIDSTSEPSEQWPPRPSRRPFRKT